MLIVTDQTPCDSTILNVPQEDVAEDVLSSFAIAALNGFKDSLASKGYVYNVTRDHLRNSVLRGTTPILVCLTFHRP